MVQAVFCARVKAVRGTAEQQQEGIQFSQGMLWCRPSIVMFSCEPSRMTMPATSANRAQRPPGNRAKGAKPGNGPYSQAADVSKGLTACPWSMT